MSRSKKGKEKICTSFTFWIDCDGSVTCLGLFVLRVVKMADLFEIGSD